MAEKTKRLTIELEVCRAQRSNNGLVFGVMLSIWIRLTFKIRNDQDTTGLTYEERYGCSSASSTVKRFFGSKVCVIIIEMKREIEREQKPYQGLREEIDGVLGGVGE